MCLDTPPPPAESIDSGRETERGRFCDVFSDSESDDSSDEAGDAAEATENRYGHSLALTHVGVVTVPSI